MKKCKRLGILVILLGVLSVATVMLTRYEEKQEQIRSSEEVILEVPVDSVLTLSWEYGDTSLSFHREEGWVYDGDGAFPVDDEKIAGLLQQFEAFSTAFIIEAVENYGQYGLESPECTIRFTTDDASYEMKLGSFSTMDEKRYVDIGDGNVYLVTNDPLDAFDAELRDLIRQDTVPELEEVTSLSFSGIENDTIRRDESGTGSYSDYDVYFTGDGRVLDTDKVDLYLYTLEKLDLTDYVTYNATEEELESWGLDQPELTINVVYAREGEEDTEAFTLHVSRDPQTREEEETTGYVRVGDSPIVYQVDGETCEALLDVSEDALRHREVFWGEFEGIYQMDITLEGENHTLVAVSDEEEICWYFREEEGAEAGEPLDMTSLETGLNNLRASQFTSESPSQKEEIRLTLYLNSENFPQVEIVMYRYDGTSCLAQVDGEIQSFVPRSAVVDLVEAVQTLVLN